MSTAQIQDHIMMHRPAHAYLGRVEMRAMQREFEQHCTIDFINSGVRGEAQFKYCGCLLHEVLEVSHVGFSVEVQA
jgi:hypothetical protein